jgi:hypothetical protein
MFEELMEALNALMRARAYLSKNGCSRSRGRLGVLSPPAWKGRLE